MRYLTLGLFLCARGALSQLTCTSTTCPANSACVFSGLRRACCRLPVTCLPPCITGTSPCPGLPDFCCPERYQCTQDQLSGQINCGPLQSTSFPQSNSPTSSGSSVTTPLTMTSVTSDTVTTTTPPLSGSTSSGSSSSDSSTSTRLAVPSASPGQNYTITSDDPSISYNGTSSSNGPSPPDAWVRGNVQDLPTIPSCADVGAVHSTTQVNASLTFPFVGTGISIRCVVSPEGGPFSVTIGNQTQNFNASSSSTQCGAGIPLSQSEFSMLILQNTMNQTGVQIAVVRNEGGKFSFIGATVFNDRQGVIISSAYSNRGGDNMFTMLSVVLVFSIWVLL